MSSSSMTMDVETVSPELAKKYLTKNKRNRPLCRSRVARLVAEIKAGEWVLSHQGIAFSPSGHMLDGQHRCQAIAEAGVPVQIPVFRNCDPRTFNKIDQGQRRNHADLYVLDGGRSEHPNVIVAAAGAMLRCGRQNKDTKITAWDVAKHAKAHEHVLIPIIDVMVQDRHGNSSIVNAVMGKAAESHGVGPVLELCRRYVEQRWLGSGDPLKKLRETIIDNKLAHNQKKLLGSQVYGYAVTAITAALSGKSLSRLRRTSRDFAEAASL